MKNLDIFQIKAQLNRGKSIEQFLGTGNSGEREILKWIEIRPEKYSFTLVYHEVYNDSDEGIESVYNYSYVMPDDLYGKNITESKSVEEILNKAQSIFGNGNFYNEGFLDEIIK
ncbi:hypothetical protein [Algoriphagus chordae]|uniref:Uncharacterized protein n=1 Tax=Algoriphagus chordae TaxID=237019 RepID=A0A2W7QRF3_9BACT|nr:hypothetical protein [Algoriphagus chordae]PZX49836.1 hypothetical protein LV85_02899 [Algoriphagus chordae]